MAPQWRNAASLIIAARATKPCAGKTSVAEQVSQIHSDKLQSAAQSPNKSTDSELRVFMVQRSDNATFMPSVFVFPGGGVHPVDFNDFWAAPYRRLLKEHHTASWLQRLSRVEAQPEPRPPIYDSYRPTDRGTPWLPAEWAFRVCALRELYEECGILVLSDQRTVSQRPQIVSVGADGTSNVDGLMCPAPDDVRNKPELFLDMFRDNERYSLAFWQLLEWSNWLTPAFSKNSKRFDTIFYLLCIDQPSEFSICQRELQDAQWIEPTRMLTNSLKGLSRIAPPQVYELGRLTNFKALEHLQSFATDRAQKAGLVRITPQIVRTADNVTVSVLHGDSLYKVADDCVYPRQMEKSCEELRQESDCLHRAEFHPHESDSNYIWSNWRLYAEGFPDPSCHIKPAFKPVGL